MNQILIKPTLKDWTWSGMEELGYVESCDTLISAALLNNYHYHLI